MLFFGNLSDGHLVPRFMDQILEVKVFLVVEVHLVLSLVLVLNPLVEVDGDELQGGRVDDECQDRRDLTQPQLGSAKVGSFQTNQTLANQDWVHIGQVVVTQIKVLQTVGVLRHGRKEHLHLRSRKITKAEPCLSEAGQRTCQQ